MTGLLFSRNERSEQKMRERLIRTCHVGTPDSWTYVPSSRIQLYKRLSTLHITMSIRITSNLQHLSISRSRNARLSPRKHRTSFVHSAQPLMMKGNINKPVRCENGKENFINYRDLSLFLASPNLLVPSPSSISVYLRDWFNFSLFHGTHCLTKEPSTEEIIKSETAGRKDSLNCNFAFHGLKKQIDNIDRMDLCVVINNDLFHIIDTRFIFKHLSVHRSKNVVFFTGNKLALKTGETRWKTFMKQRISMAIQKGNAATLEANKTLHVKKYLISTHHYRFMNMLICLLTQKRFSVDKLSVKRRAKSTSTLNKQNVNVAVACRRTNIKPYTDKKRICFVACNYEFIDQKVTIDIWILFPILSFILRFIRQNNALCSSYENAKDSVKRTYLIYSKTICYSDMYLEGISSRLNDTMILS
ncbi:hypothetical protein Bhyg_02320 [Pseudolycoriella hygida]|uniref:Uncharacterized protein n=1 Tax=Pseudolycoriella hygida TaxID=35572 RepID=A0A9Q0NB57_9DIPT|nr:hypothetical protein Bhyg_02320 [Pseudolycoriella hygida]